MSLGEWDSAVLKSATYVGLGIAFSALFTDYFHAAVNDFFDLIIFLFLYTSFYLLLSVIGWLVVGFPVHWLASKYTNGSYFYYIALPLIFVLFCLLKSYSLLFGLAALLQAIVFRFYVYPKQNKLSSKRHN